MSEVENLEKAYNYSNYSRTINNQINLLKLKVKKQLRFSINGGMFEITPEFLIHVKSYAEQGIYRAVFLDINDIPIKIEDLEEFYQEILTKERNVLNEYYEEFEKIRMVRKLTDLLDD